MRGIELKQIFSQNGFSQAEIAEMIGESQQNFSAALRSDNVKSGLIERVAKAMNKPISFLYGEGGQIANASGEHSTAIAGNNISNNSNEQFIAILKQKDEQLSKVQEQMDRLLDLLQKSLK